MVDPCPGTIPSRLPCCPDAPATSPCGRPRGHLGDCGYSEQPDPPLRPVHFSDGSLAVTIPDMLTQPAHRFHLPLGIRP